jgi:lipocalin
MKILIFLGLISLIFSMSLKTKDINTCNNVNFQIKDFNPENLLGTWYPIAHTEQLFFSLKCDYLNLLKRNDNAFYLEKVNRKYLNNTRNFRVLLNKTSYLNSALLKFEGIDHLVTVVETDYLNYAVVLMCSDTDPKSYNVIILSREPNMSSDLYTQLLNYTRNTLNITQNFKIVPQDVCDARFSEDME